MAANFLERKESNELEVLHITDPQEVIDIKRKKEHSTIKTLEEFINLIDQSRLTNRNDNPYLVQDNIYGFPQKLLFPIIDNSEITQLLENFNVDFLVNNLKPILICLNQKGAIGDATVVVHSAINRILRYRQNPLLFFNEFDDNSMQICGQSFLLAVLFCHQHDRVSLIKYLLNRHIPAGVLSDHLDDFYCFVIDEALKDITIITQLHQAGLGGNLSYCNRKRMGILSIIVGDLIDDIDLEGYLKIIHQLMWQHINPLSWMNTTEGQLKKHNFVSELLLKLANSNYSKNIIKTIILSLEFGGGLSSRKERSEIIKKEAIEKLYEEIKPELSGYYSIVPMERFVQDFLESEIVLIARNNQNKLEFIFSLRKLRVILEDKNQSGQLPCLEYIAHNVQKSEIHELEPGVKDLFNKFDLNQKITDFLVENVIIPQHIQQLIQQQHFKEFMDAIERYDASQYGSLDHKKDDELFFWGIHCFEIHKHHLILVALKDFVEKNAHEYFCALLKAVQNYLETQSPKQENIFEKFVLELETNFLEECLSFILLYCLQKGQVNLFIKLFAKVSSDLIWGKQRNSPLLECVKLGDEKLIPLFDFLLKITRDPYYQHIESLKLNYKNADGNTLLHFFCDTPSIAEMYLSQDWLSYLIEQGMDVFLKNNEGKNAFSIYYDYFYCNSNSNEFIYSHFFLVKHFFSYGMGFLKKEHRFHYNTLKRFSLFLASTSGAMLYLFSPLLNSEICLYLSENENISCCTVQDFETFLNTQDREQTQTYLSERAMNVLQAGEDIVPAIRKIFLTHVENCRQFHDFIQRSTSLNEASSNIVAAYLGYLTLQNVNQVFLLTKTIIANSNMFVQGPFVDMKITHEELSQSLYRLSQILRGQEANFDMKALYENGFLFQWIINNNIDYELYHRFILENKLNEVLTCLEILKKLGFKMFNIYSWKNNIPFTFLESLIKRAFMIDERWVDLSTIGIRLLSILLENKMSPFHGGSTQFLWKWVRKKQLIKEFLTILELHQIPLIEKNDKLKQHCEEMLNDKMDEITLTALVQLMKNGLVKINERVMDTFLRRCVNEKKYLVLLDILLKNGLNPYVNDSCQYIFVYARLNKQENELLEIFSKYQIPFIKLGINFDRNLYHLLEGPEDVLSLRAFEQLLQNEPDKVFHHITPHFLQHLLKNEKWKFLDLIVRFKQVVPEKTALIDLFNGVLEGHVDLVTKIKSSLDKNDETYRDYLNLIKLCEQLRADKLAIFAKHQYERQQNKRVREFQNKNGADNLLPGNDGNHVDHGNRRSLPGRRTPAMLKAFERHVDRIWRPRLAAYKRDSDHKGAARHRGRLKTP